MVASVSIRTDWVCWFWTVVRIVGIANVAIPKILANSQNQQYNAVVKEAASTVAVAYQQYALQNTVGTATTANDIVKTSLNYVKADSSTVIDESWSGGTRTCGQNGDYCYKLANGAMLMATSCHFSTTNSNGAVLFRVDPTGTNDGVLSTLFYLQINGKMWTEGTRPMSPTIVSSGGCNPTWVNVADPSYLAW